MFLKFEKKEDRQAYGGTAFVELQYCKLPVDASNKEIVAVDAIKNWDATSLYIYSDEMNAFYSEYKDVLGDGLYHNMKEGTVDLYGINYYNVEKTKNILHKLDTLKPKEYAIFLQWLKDNPHDNGFYILGI